jgi:site-specific DNA recombinase
MNAERLLAHYERIGNPRRAYLRQPALELAREGFAWLNERIETAFRAHGKVGDRINAMYLDKLDGRVDTTFFDKMSAEWREEHNRDLREIERHEAAEQSYMDEGVQILELVRNAQRLFEQQEPRQKCRLLNFVLSNCPWKDGEVIASFRQPFDLLAETGAIAARQKAGNTAVSAKTGIWLGDLDSNQGFPGQSREFYR